MKRLKNIINKYVGAGLVAGLMGLSASSVMAQEVINIGFSGPLSGAASLYGKNVLYGMETGVEDVNKKGITIDGKTYHFKVVALDDKYAPSETAVNARRLVQENKSQFIFVPHSGGTFALQTFNVRSNFLILSFSSLKAVLEKKNPLTVRIPEAYERYFPTFIKFQMEKYGKKLGIATTNSDYGRTFSKDFEAAWKAAGGEVVANNLMAYNTSADFYSGLGRILDSKPDVLLIGGPSEPTALVAKQARELGFKGGFILTDQAKLNEMERVLGDYSLLEGALGVLPVIPEIRPESIPFMDEFVKNHPSMQGRAFSSDITLNYAMIRILANAMELANSKDDLKAIMGKLDEAVKKLEPHYNPIQISGYQNGSLVYNSSVAMVENGKLVRHSLVRGE
ncbi:MAG: ABC transporter substrate-binding protein [Pelistega sp.]|nr:ABC transporter substrate-binding protein [Pelistega sp.]